MKLRLGLLVAGLFALVAAPLSAQETSEISEPSGDPGVAQEIPIQGDGPHDTLRVELGDIGVLDIQMLAELVVTLDQAMGGYAVDRYGTELDEPLGLNTQARVGVAPIFVFDAAIPLRLLLEAEIDAITGGLLDASATEGTSMPGPNPLEYRLRKARGIFSVGPFLHLGAGLTTSQQGLGLLANAGATRWEPGSAAFIDPRRGDVSERYFVATGPYPGAPLSIAAFFDRSVDDDILLAGDSAQQAGGTLTYGTDEGTQVGIYVVWREQIAEDGDLTEVMATDLNARVPIELNDDGSMKLTLQTEIAFINGSTELAPSSDFPVHKVNQIGAALRANFSTPSWGVVLDFLYASGDRNLDDNAQNGFKTDYNFEMGLLLFRHVLRAHTGRVPVTAGDPDLTGYPAEDLDRFATRGSITNTISLFPRAYYTPVDGLEIYGGPLIAFTEVESVDPLNTRVEGGSPRNALAGEPTSFLGVELDLGVRYRYDIWLTSELLTTLTAGLEGAALFPGGALDGPAGDLGALFGGRFILEYRL